MRSGPRPARPIGEPVRGLDRGRSSRSGAGRGPLPASIQQRRLQRVPPYILPRVVGPESRTELPVRPAEPQPAGLPAHEPRPPDPRFQIGLLERPELPQEDRPVVLLPPLRRSPQRLPNRLLLAVAA